MERMEGSQKFPIGSKIPEFKLLNTDEKYVETASLLEGADALLVVFTCNHCPYVKGSEEYLISTIKEFEGKGLAAVAINSNDPVKYPDDSFEQMQKKAENMSLPYPYLFDESQETARAFDAACTPECFLFDGAGVLKYHGAINDSHREPAKVSKNHIKNAIEKVLAGEPIDQAYVHTMGCSIKWK